MFTVTMKDGRLITIEEEELRAANTKVSYDPRTKTLLLAIAWQDTGIVGDPVIEIDDNSVVVSVRKPCVDEDLSVLGKAKAVSDQIVNSIRIDDDLVGVGSPEGEY